MTSFRPRPIDVEKPLFIVREELNEDETRSIPALATGMEQHEENEAHIRDAIAEAQRKKTRLQANIPTPIIRIVSDYDATTQKWARPSTFIKISPPVNPLFRDPLSGPIEYDVDSEDEEWLGKLNNAGAQLGEDDLELLVDSFEKAVARDHVLSFSTNSQNGVITLQRAKDLVHELPRNISPQVVECVYNYWLNKRNRLKRPLLLSLLPPPASDDPSPFVAFRPRDKENKKRSRKSNKSVLQQLHQLRKELEQARSILETVKKRERLKRELILSKKKAFEIRYVQKSRQVNIKSTRKRSAGKRYSDIFSIEDSSDESETNEFLANIESDSQFSWDRFPPHMHNEAINAEGKTYWGRVKLPGITPFRGRIRVGRGGRIFGDRAESLRSSPHDKILWY